MTVESQVNRSGPFIASGTSGSFPRNFLLFDPAHLRVVRVRDGVEEDITTGITHSGLGSASGMVTISGGLQSGDRVTLIRNMPHVQRSDYSAQSSVPTDQVELDFDLLAMQIQDLAERQQRALTLPVDATETGEEAMRAALAAPAYALQAKDYADEARDAAGALKQYEGGFFANSASPGSITRLANRVFVGDAWTFTGGTEGNNPVGTWLNTSGGPQVQPGTVSITNGSVNVSGAGTQFTRLAEGGPVTIGGSVYVINTIASNTAMTLQTPATQTLTGVAFSAGTATRGYLANFANLLVTNDYGIGVTGAVTSSTANSVFGGAFLAQTANAGGRGWALYVEAIKANAAASYTHGAEIEVANLFPPVSDGFKPYGGRVDGQVWGLTIGSGADPVVNPVTYSADTAIAVTGVGSDFLSGLVFENDALVTHADGKKRAVMLPTLGTISWWDASHNQVLDITSSASGAAKAVSVVHNNLGVTLNNGAGHPFLFVNRGPDGAQVDYPGLVSTNGGGARITANGPGANIHLELSPKGDGNVVIPLSSIRSYGSDSAAAAAGVPVGGLYRSGNALMIRLT